MLALRRRTARPTPIHAPRISHSAGDYEGEKQWMPGNSPQEHHVQRCLTQRRPEVDRLLQG